MADAPKKRGRGRPPFVPTDAQRERVKDMVAIGAPQAEIAGSIRVSIETLKNHFESELRYGRAERRAETARTIFSEARTGNLAALKLAEQLTAQSGMQRPIMVAAPKAAEPKAPPPPPLPKEVKLGKKEQAKIDAANPDPSTPMGELMARRQAAAGSDPDSVH